MRINFIKTYTHPENKHRVFYKGQEINVTEEFGIEAIKAKAAEKIEVKEPEHRKKKGIKIKGKWQQ